ncbi:acyltransferase family protein, partial [Nocardioides sp. YIM 152588]|uniref:acyltransferase family protein n=1 Tax=Nocardioides sp. YIM 152588 TaxID=3158259 RepID=UPI0032E4697F
MPPTSRREPTTPARDPWLDNAKAALVTLVVVGHAWTLLPADGPTARLYDFLYAWHMPAFVLVTGYLSRGFSYRPDRLANLVRTVAVPYVVFECAMALFRVYVGGERLEDLFADPHWPMWFLPALFAWRLLTPLFRPLPAGLAVAVAVSLAAGLWAGDTLDVARVLGLLPFFVLGLKATPERLEWLRGPLPAATAVAVLVGIWLLSAHTDRWAATEWLYYRSTYDELAVGDARAVLTRAVLLAVGAAGALAFLALVPRTAGWFSRMGSATLVVYLCHGFAVKGAEYAGYQEWAAAHLWPAVVVTTLGAVALALALGCAPVARRLTPLVDPFGAAREHVRGAVHLTALSPDLGYANLAIRGRKLRAIVDEQLEPALALKPDLVS